MASQRRGLGVLKLMTLIFSNEIEKLEVAGLPKLTKYLGRFKIELGEKRKNPGRLPGFLYAKERPSSKL